MALVMGHGRLLSVMLLVIPDSITLPLIICLVELYLSCSMPEKLVYPPQISVGTLRFYFANHIFLKNVPNGQCLERIFWRVAFMFIMPKGLPRTNASLVATTFQPFPFPITRLAIALCTF